MSMRAVGLTACLPPVSALPRLIRWWSDHSPCMHAPASAAGAAARRMRADKPPWMFWAHQPRHAPSAPGAASAASASVAAPATQPSPPWLLQQAQQLLSFSHRSAPAPPGPPPAAALTRARSSSSGGAAAAQQPTHLIVLVNGLFGGPGNWAVVCEALAQRLGGGDVLLHPSGVNVR